jgi:hypothetical protein
MEMAALRHVWRSGTGGLEARVAQKKLKKILKEYLKFNVCMWGDNIKMDVKETSFVFRLNSSLPQVAK